MERDSNINYGHNDPDFNTEIMQDKEPAINEYLDNSYNDQQNRDNDPSDPYFQKNASIAQDLPDNDDHDPDRRTLDEYDANHAESEDQLDELDDEKINQNDKSDE
ncbi:hypothetical protein [Flavobacterium sp.]|uniref:hypothetical protein n=1 Tax=Flavobacterium sp. TaxID=239 RepID=UPI003263A639